MQKFWQSRVTLVDVDTGEILTEETSRNHVVIKTEKLNDYENRIIKITKQCRKQWAGELFK